MNKKYIILLLKGIADFFACSQGNCCEVVVHDLEKLDHSLIHVAGNITNRKSGAPITDLIYRALKKYGDKVDDILNYKNYSPDGTVLRSSTFFVRDDMGHVCACLCVNNDVTDIISAQAMLGNLINMNIGDTQEYGETFATSMDETVISLVEKEISHFGKHPKVMNRQEKILFVSALDRLDIFKIRGAVEKVALSMGLSRHSIYNYIKECKK